MNSKKKGCQDRKGTNSYSRGKVARTRKGKILGNVTMTRKGTARRKVARSRKGKTL